jgi:anti-anti-sigma factor
MVNGTLGGYYMTISKTQENGKIILQLEGRLDTTTAPELQTVLIPAFDDAKEINVKFDSVAYVSSAGLRVILMGQKEAKKKNASMIISGVSDEIMEVFEMTGFAAMLDIV